MRAKRDFCSSAATFFAVLALCALGMPRRANAAACADTAYVQEFEGGAPLPTEWASGTGTFGAGTGGFFGGLPGFGGGFIQNTTVPPRPSVLRLENLPRHSSVDVDFLLAIINTWDGVGTGAPAGPDSFNVTVNGALVFSHVFGLNGNAPASDYSPPPGGLMGASGQWDRAFNMFLEPAFQGIPDTSSTLEIRWFASGPYWEGGGNESWAIDHVRVVLYSADTPTVLTLTSDVNPSVFGQAVNFTATLAPPDAPGTVDFFLNASPTPFASRPVVGGVATASLAGLPVGIATMEARYSGHVCSAAATSPPIGQVITPVGTTVALTSTPNPSTSGNSVMLVASVSPPTGTGSVEFFDGASSLGSTTLAGGSATLPVSSLPAGSHSLTALYGGDSNHYGGTSPVVIQTVVSPYPMIAAIRDVPNDQGGRVFLAWRCALDEPRLQIVTGYRVWRRAPSFTGVESARADSSSALHAARGSQSPRVIRIARPDGTTQESFWEAIATLPSEQLVSYAYTALTTQDSLPGTNPYTAFFVTALTANPFVFYESNVDSAYSVDNLSPPAPAPFVARYTGGATTLHWSASHAPDLLEFRLYRGATPSFTPSGANLLAATRDTSFRDPTQIAYTYKLVAVDVHGNLSRVLAVTPERPVATLASLASADAFPDRVSLVWYVAGGSGPAATVYRWLENGAWQAVAQITPDGEGYLRYEDTDVQPGLRYGYRLGIHDAGVEVFAGEAWVTTVSPAFSLEGASPNPAAVGRFAIAFSLPGDEPAQLDVLDVSGRRVLTRDLNGVGVGRHVADLSGQAGIAPGVYLVRLTYGGRAQVRRVVMLR